VKETGAWNAGPPVAVAIQHPPATDDTMLVAHTILAALVATWLVGIVAILDLITRH
jgi:hypothetical protein